MVILTMLNQILVLFLLMGVGYAFAKAGVINEKGSDQMATLLCYIILPCTILYSFLMKFKSNLFRNFLIMCVITFGIHLFNIFISTLIFNKKTVPDNEERRVLHFSSIYSNCGFMGFPLLQSLAGTTGLFYGSAYNSIFGLFAWTHGFSLFSEKPDKKTILKAVLNPNIVASIIGMIFYCLSISLPSPIYWSVKYLSQLNTGLSMIIIGTTMTQISWSRLSFSFHTFMGVAVRNLILPLTLLFILYAVGIRGQLLLCSLIPAACPVAGLSVIFSKLTGKDVVLPCKVMTLSTIASLVTMPFILGITNLL